MYFYGSVLSSLGPLSNIVDPHRVFLLCKSFSFFLSKCNRYSRKRVRVGRVTPLWETYHLLFPSPVGWTDAWDRGHFGPWSGRGYRGPRFEQKYLSTGSGYGHGLVEVSGSEVRLRELGSEVLTGSRSSRGYRVPWSRRGCLCPTDYFGVQGDLGPRSERGDRGVSRRSWRGSLDQRSGSGCLGRRYTPPLSHFKNMHQFHFNNSRILCENIDITEGKRYQNERFQSH